MSDDGQYHGHMTMSDGTHVALSADEAKALWEEVERRNKELATRLPDEKSALAAMFEAFCRLKQLGWREAIYCPKDGTPFQAIEAGSTGIFDCSYVGAWPDGSWWVSDGGDLWPASPILFRLYPTTDCASEPRS